MNKKSRWDNISKKDRKNALKKNKNNKKLYKFGEGQLALSLAIAGFLFCCTTFALVKGLEMWNLNNIFPSIIGWGVVLVIFLLSFWKWIKIRRNFIWSIKWFFYIPIIATLGIGLAFILSVSINQWQKKSHFNQVLNNNAKLVNMTSNWTPGDYWNKKQCNLAVSDNKFLKKKLFRGNKPPLISDIRLFMGTSKVIYQAGCDISWDKLKQYMLNTPPKWEITWKVQKKLDIQYLNQHWPNGYQGCMMEQSRAMGLHPELKMAFSLVCSHAQMDANHVWAPGKYLLKAKKRHKEIQKIKEKQTENNK